MLPRCQPTVDATTLPAELAEKVASLQQKVATLIQQAAALAAISHSVPDSESDDDIEGIFNPIFDESGDKGEGKKINFDSIFDPYMTNMLEKRKIKLSIFLQPLMKVMEKKKKKKTNFLLIQFLRKLNEKMNV
ncbi:hypothetical protein TIFTF001_002852 [Ficus carica]|uniref:Uncharacterized protein n=1 Tax=Ficus carica TaxID=3494 RepID=A0AA87Z9R7_FICCA|nr:hypothetical protein TIFTF001_002852 [Ficus carica]